MPATPEQLQQLRQGVIADPSWKLIERGGRVSAEQEIAVTDTYRWTFRLAPVEDNDFFAWSIKGDLLDQERYRGSFNDCLWWLDTRMTRAERARDVAGDLVGFAADRRHWRFFDRGDGRHCAGRTFEHPDGQRFLLSVFPHHSGRRRPRFTAQLNAPFSAGPEHQADVDTVADAGAWVKAWSAPLEVPIKLNGCTRGREARDICRLLSAEQITKLAHLVGIHMVSRGQIECELIRRYAPTARG